LDLVRRAGWRGTRLWCRDRDGDRVRAWTWRRHLLFLLLLLPLARRYGDTDRVALLLLILAAAVLKGPYLDRGTSRDVHVPVNLILGPPVPRELDLDDLLDVVLGRRLIGVLHQHHIRHAGPLVRPGLRARRIVLAQDRRRRDLRHIVGHLR